MTGQPYGKPAGTISRELEHADANVAYLMQAFTFNHALVIAAEKQRRADREAAKAA